MYWKRKCADSQNYMLKNGFDIKYLSFVLATETIFNFTKAVESQFLSYFRLGQNSCYGSTNEEMFIASKC